MIAPSKHNSKSVCEVGDLQGNPARYAEALATGANAYVDPNYVVRAEAREAWGAVQKFPLPARKGEQPGVIVNWVEFCSRGLRRVVGDAETPNYIKLAPQ